MLSQTYFTVLYIGKSKTLPKLINQLAKDATFSIKLEIVDNYDSAVDFFNEVYADYQNKTLCIFDLSQVENEGVVLEYINTQYPNTKTIILYKDKPWSNSLSLLNNQLVDGMVNNTDSELIVSVLSKNLNEMFRLDQLEIENTRLTTELKEVKQKLSLRTTELTQKNLALQELSVTDKLTQMPNRLKLDEQFNFNLQSSERYQNNFSIILLDIDHFKQVNDTFGHQAGDDVLVSLSKILKNNLRNTDMVGRWGGEEFLILCPNSNLEMSVVLANKLRKLIEDHPFDVVEKITASFGVTTFRKNDTETIMLARADEALYEAKEQGRNIVIER